jgi:hypothetical protein
MTEKCRRGIYPPASVGGQSADLQRFKEVKLEIEEIVKQISAVKRSIEDAFEKGSIDFDQISAELDTIENELQAKGAALALNQTQRLHLTAKEASKNNRIISANDYK